ncbi:glycerol uptake facilitator-like aquaporin [Microbacterium endophyticum]|uniref:Glycerol uptake facilitator-like aquaporin n=2 Tax=Microbacterium endophyticum TaxID=1526412 RepID=A0A7W4YMZ2_9MICO|nr:MIP/aquaporin family protein [Microbacterium endophyticum]MBB2975592.1 glycerol uptake facilitator-like aquaporin [Microbacterium endophyticum]NIK35389.1 glycerol uptake facilitator-like aquaporin [Microbacterium endophyticum]
MNFVPTIRRAVAEFLGTGMLVTIVVGSGIAAERLSDDPGVQLLANSIATALGLAVLILMFGRISGAHFNPVVSLVDAALGRRHHTGLSLPMTAIYLVAQFAGGITGAVLANAMFALPTSLSTTDRATPATFLAEIVATAGLILLIIALARTGQTSAAAPAIGAYIGAAYWFTSSTSFANPAVTIGRIFSDSFAGIAPASVLLFIAAQLIGGAVGALLAIALFPHADRAADDMVIPHEPEPKD